MHKAITLREPIVGESQNQHDDKLLEIQRSSANDVVERLNDVLRPGKVQDALDPILDRVVGSGNSLATLRNFSQHDYAFDAMTILRTTYDIMLQGLFILHDASLREERARLYLDFICVEQHRRFQQYEVSQTDLAHRLKLNPRWAQSEQEIKEEFKEVEEAYRVSGGRHRMNWYPKDLRHLAQEVGLEAEYKLVQPSLSGVVHSSPLTLRQVPVLRDFNLLDWSWRFAFRLLGAYAEFKGVTLNDFEQTLVEMAREIVFNFPEDSSR